jgi:CSLREA domain-containing protein
MIQVRIERLARSSKAMALGFVLALVTASLLLTAQPAQAATITVNTDADDQTVNGNCTLREAIRSAREDLPFDACASGVAGADTINFNIPGSGVKTIGVGGIGGGLGDLPVITETMTIDATTQPGFSGTPLIELDGSSLGATSRGLVISAGNGTKIRGFAINRFRDGIVVFSDGNIIVGNFVGTDPSGMLDRGNLNGIVVSGSNNRVGGTTATDRNVVSGNNGDGIIIGSFGNTVEGNFIGTDAAGTADLGNTDDGVLINNGASDNIVGGTTTAARNVISGNDGDGVEINGATTTGNKVLNNRIGNVAGGGNGIGIHLTGARDTVVGAPGDGNVISLNNVAGIFMDGGAEGTLVQSNFIGTDKDGADLGNLNDGVAFGNSSNNTTGGTKSGEGNVIAFNGNASTRHGIALRGGTGNHILSNSIFSNSGLGIDLGNDNVLTPNDSLDPDTGANNLQNSPEIASAKPTKKKKKKLTTITGTLNSNHVESFTLQFFSNPSGEDEGKKFIGSRSVTTDASGNASFSIRVARSKAPVASVITATATRNSTGDTSEFSGAVIVS